MVRGLFVLQHLLFRSPVIDRVWRGILGSLQKSSEPCYVLLQFIAVLFLIAFNVLLLLVNGSISWQLRNYLYKWSVFHSNQMMANKFWTLTRPTRSQRHTRMYRWHLWPGRNTTSCHVLVAKYVHRVKLEYGIKLLSLQFLAFNFKDVYTGMYTRGCLGASCGEFPRKRHPSIFAYTKKLIKILAVSETISIG